MKDFVVTKQADGWVRILDQSGYKSHGKVLWEKGSHQIILERGSYKLLGRDGGDYASLAAAKHAAMSQPERRGGRRGKENPMTKNEKYAAYAAVGGAVVLGGALLYHFSSAKSGSTAGSKTINVNAVTATIGNVFGIGTTVHANVGDTVAVELGPPPAALGGGYIDQSSANLALQLPITGYAMNYKVNGPGTIAIGYKAANAPSNAQPQQIVAFSVAVP